MNRFRLFIILTVMLAQCNVNSPEVELKIGNYYPDVLHGITFLFENNQAFLFKIGFLDSTGQYIDTYTEHFKIKKDSSGQKFGPAAPDYSYNKYGFTTDMDNTIWLEWSKTEDGRGAVGKIYADNEQEIFLEAMQSFPEVDKIFYGIKEESIVGWLDSLSDSGEPDWYFNALNQQPTQRYAVIHQDETVEQQIKDNKQVTDMEKGYAIANSYVVSADNPLYFYAGADNSHPDTKSIEAILDITAEQFAEKRARVETPFGEIWEAVSNHLNHSRVYGTQTRLTGHVVSRGWMGEVNQRLFEWDTFFHAMLASIEDPQGAKESVRAILAFQTPEGIVPNSNFGNDTVRNSNDRSQPPVGSICVWKIYQFHPDKEFLKEVYPKLLKWHNWWFDIRPSNGLPYRDGNQNGLLEWGTEIDTWLQGAKYESGQDNSPMFDDARMNEISRTMELDMAGLSGLWAADALFLSYIAEAIGKSDDAAMLQKQAQEMNERINEVLWNEEVGMYCNKYWDKYSKKPRPEVFKGIPVETYTSVTFEYKNDEGTAISGKDVAVAMDQELLNKAGLNTRVYDPVYMRFDYPVSYEFTLKPQKSGAYFFYTPEEFGVELIVDGHTLIDNRFFWITEYISNPIYFEAGKEYTCKLNYTGDIPFQLQWAMEQESDGSLFSHRYGPTLFYPLISGAPDSAKAQKILNNLLDQKLFWGDYVIPTISRDDPAFPTQGYWRGRIWPPTNYLAYLGIKEYGNDSIAWQIAEKSARQAQAEWVSRGHLYENYFAYGHGSGDPHYCWGGLMQFMVVEELLEKKDNDPVEGYHLINFP